MNMLKEKGTVVAVAQGKAWVKTRRVNACHSCSSQQGCGTQALAKLTSEAKSKGEQIFEVASLMSLRVGQEVEVGIHARLLLLAALLLYAVPLFALLAATFAAQWLFHQEWQMALFILASTALAFVLVRFLSQALSRRPAFQPILLRTF